MSFWALHLWSVHLFKFLLSTLIFLFTSMFLLKLRCSLRKWLLFIKCHQSCFSFRSFAIFLRASGEVDFLPALHWWFPSITASFFWKHFALWVLVLSGYITPVPSPCWSPHQSLINPSIHSKLKLSLSESSLSDRTPSMIFFSLLSYSSAFIFPYFLCQTKFL